MDIKLLKIRRPNRYRWAEAWRTMIDMAICTLTASIITTTLAPRYKAKIVDQLVQENQMHRD